jgi:carbonic anhydrase
MPGVVETVDRGRFLRSAGIGIAMAVTTAEAPAWAAPPGVAPPPAATTPDRALELLREGNARFVAGNAHCGPLTARRLELTQGQSPFAIVLGCSDSRVPIETVFDQMPGHIFVVRLAGNFVDENGLGSIEYGVAVLKATLILVLGHSSCGAVAATVGFVEEGTPQPGHIQGLVAAIEPAVTATKGRSGDWLSNAIAENVKLNVAAVRQRSTIVDDAATSGRLRAVGGVYDLHSGHVAFL